MRFVIQIKKIIPLFCKLCLSLLLLQTSAWGAQNSLELHAGTVKIMREGKSLILRNAGEKYQLLANDRLQTGKNTEVSLYLKDGDDTVKLFSHSFFILEDISDEGNSVALLIGKFNFSIKPLPESSGAEEAESENTEKEKAPEKKLKTKLGGKLKGSLAKLGKSKLRRKKKRFELRTVTAIIGVRGTKGIGETYPNTLPPITNVGVTEGEVVFASAEDPDKPIIISKGEMSQVKQSFLPSKVVPLNTDGSMEGVLPGPAEAIAVLLEEGVTIGELLDLIDEINSIVDNAENAIDAMRSKTLILSMTFTNR
jgi:hypothetical protein